MSGHWTAARKLEIDRKAEFGQALDETGGLRVGATSKSLEQFRPPGFLRVIPVRPGSYASASRLATIPSRSNSQDGLERVLERIPSDLNRGFPKLLG